MALEKSLPQKGILTHTEFETTVNRLMPQAHRNILNICGIPRLVCL